jgi:hypothetical protein
MPHKRNRRPKNRRKATRGQPRSRAKNRTQPKHRAVPRSRKPAAKPKKLKRARKRLRSDPLVEIAAREMNRGRSLTATAQSVRVSRADLLKRLRRQGLVKRKGDRWVPRDNRLRRVPVMTNGRIQNLTLRGYDQARLVGEHHQAVGDFLRTNDLALLKPFKGRTVQTVKGRRYVFETDPNALHRIAAMDSPPFHEIYEISSAT